MTLTEFLLARIMEDEAAARAAVRSPWLPDGEGAVRSTSLPIPKTTGKLKAAMGGCVVNRPSVSLAPSQTNANAEHIARHDPARVLAECASKRRIVEYVQVVSLALDGRVSEGARCVISDRVIQMLAAVYSDHPDYREEWRP